MTLESAIERDPRIMSGALCFRGTRVPVSTLFDHLEIGRIDEFYAGFPSVSKEMVEAVLQASLELLERQVTSKAA